MRQGRRAYRAVLLLGAVLGPLWHERAVAQTSAAGTTTQRKSQPGTSPRRSRTVPKSNVQLAAHEVAGERREGSSTSNAQKATPVQPNRDRGEARASDGALPESYRMPGWLKEAEASADAEGMVRRVIWGTALVLGLCGAALWAGRRWLIGPHVAGAAPVEKMRVLGSLRLGGRAWVYWIQVGEQQALAGVDGTGIKTLTPLPSSFDGALAQFQRDEAGETPTGAAVAMTNNPTTLRSDHSPATTELRHG